MTEECKCERIMGLSGKVSDMFTAYLDGIEYNGYVPDNINVGGGDYINFTVCADCGKIQNFKPIPLSALQKSEDY